MTCISDQALRARLDSELPAIELAGANKHLAGCTACRTRFAEIELRARRASSLLGLLEPPQDVDSTDPRFALTRFEARRRQLAGEALDGRRRPRLVWATLAALVILGCIASFGGTRAWAQKILGLLRVAAVQVSNDQFSQEQFDAFDGDLRQLLSDEVVLTKEATAPQPVASAAEASLAAAFNVRLISNQPVAPALQIEGERGYQMTLNRDRLQSIVNDAGRPDIHLPAPIDGARVSVSIPKSVIATYGTCPPVGPSFSPLSSEWNDCVALVQLTSPVVLTPADFDLPQLANLGLQVAGLSEAEADAFTKSVDWTSTLVLPVPQDIASYQEVPVDGVRGMLINQNTAEGKTPGFTLLWYKNGIIYWLMGRGDSTRALALANSLH